MAWTNQKLQLFHGTHQIAADQIKAEGRFAFERTRKRTDFGRGLYTTSNYDQAQEWAEKAANKSSRKLGSLINPRVLTANVDREQLSQLAILFFARNSPDFLELIKNCRAGKNHAIKHGWYDIVVGPVSRFPRRGVFPGKDQISFHTQNACELLFNSLNWEI
jgi:hypothetical protein